MAQIVYERFRCSYGSDRDGVRIVAVVIVCCRTGRRERADWTVNAWSMMMMVMVMMMACC